jgi:hypothetical protein
VADVSARMCLFYNRFADFFAHTVSNLKRLCTDCEVAAFTSCDARSTLSLLLFSHEHSSLPVRVIDREIRESVV